MEGCPIDGEYDSCVVEHGYVKIVGKSRPVIEKKSETRPIVAPTAPKKSFPVAARKSKAGAVLALLRRLKMHEDKGIPYSTINSYFRSEFKAGGDSSPFGMFTDMLTYDPRSDPPKNYAQVYVSIQQYSESLDWMALWDVIDGLAYD